MLLREKLKLIFSINVLTILLISADLKAAQTICEKTDLSKIYLESAIEMLQKAKESYPAENLVRTYRPTDCYDLMDMGHNTSGIYTIWPINRVMKEQSVRVYCDMKTDGGGWTVIQRRGDFQRPTDYFYKNWEEYKKGFGNLDKDFWLGNDYIYAISNQKEYTARFDMKAVDGEKRYACYDYFWIDDENHNYMLHIRDYRGNAGDSMYPKHNEQMFSTKDKNNDKRVNQTPCAEIYKGAWWYNACHDSNLNGLYLKGKHESHANGVNWKSWKGHKESLEETEIKIRPKDFIPSKSVSAVEYHSTNSHSEHAYSTTVDPALDF